MRISKEISTKSLIKIVQRKGSETENEEEADTLSRVCMQVLMLTNDKYKRGLGRCPVHASDSHYAVLHQDGKALTAQIIEAFGATLKTIDLIQSQLGATEDIWAENQQDQCNPGRRHKSLSLHFIYLPCLISHCFMIQIHSHFLLLQVKIQIQLKSPRFQNQNVILPTSILLALRITVASGIPSLLYPPLPKFTSQVPLSLFSFFCLCQPSL